MPSGVTQMVCPAANNCWALGYSLNSRGTYYGGRFLRYHQASLTDEVPPAPPGATASSGIGLVSISCSSASFCVAVGYFYPSGVTEDRPVLEMFANGVWSLKPVPLPRYSNPANGAELDSVSCTPGNHCVAVGSYNTDQNGESQALILTVSAHHVSEIRAPLPPQAIAWGRQTAQLLSVSCTRSDRCVAVGGFTNKGGVQRVLVVAKTHARWTVRPVANRGAGAGGTLTSVSCRSNGHCAAVGDIHQCTGCFYSSGVVAAGSVRGDWTSHSLPLPSQFGSGDMMYVGGIMCPSAGPCVGDLSYGGSGTDKLAFLNYTNGHWRDIPGPPYPTVTGFDYIAPATPPSCPSPNWCVAVGGRTQMDPFFQSPGVGFIYMGTP